MAQTTTPSSDRFMFPRWANYALPLVIIGALGGAIYVPVVVAFGGSPKTMAVGYAPTQPVPYSHALHAGKLGLDCRYCHNTVEKTAFANLPPTQTCMNCHTNIHTLSPALAPIRHSWETGEPMHWIKIHNLAQYVYFNHSAHVSHGVGCIECHGRIDRMDVVRQEKPLSMGWCLDCHRDPGSHLRPREVAVTNMPWAREKMSKDDIGRLPERLKAYFDTPTGDDNGEFMMMSAGKSDQLSKELLTDYGIRGVPYMQSCSTCHR
jgi:menaquinone reductase, multiheme cytochrome c subunit